MGDESIPAVCFIADIVRICRISRRSLVRMRKYRVFPIPELPALDSRPRWSGTDVQRYLEHQPYRRLRRVS